MLKEFKEFAFKGNVVDMAVGIIIGGAFGTVVKSMVDDIMMPLIGMITGGIDFSERYTLLNAAEGATYETADAAREAGVAVMTWGNFITAFISFIFLALAVFIVIKKVLEGMKKEEEEPEEDPGPSEIDLLTEIRDSLANK